MVGQIRHSTTSETIAEVRYWQGTIAKASAEIDRTVVNSQEIIAESRELIARADKELARRRSPPALGTDSTLRP